MSKQLTTKDAEAAKIQIIEDANKGNQAVHDLVTAYRANRRSGSANTKTRAEVAGTGKKMYRQKGTGNARHGTSKAPIFVGGGVAFGPKPRSYAKKVPGKVRKLALRKVLGARITADAVYSVGSFNVSSGKTKDFIKEVQGITDAASVLIVGKSFEDSTYLAGRNVSWTQLVTAESVNVEELLHYRAIVLVEDAFETLAERTA